MCHYFNGYSIGIAVLFLDPNTEDKTVVAMKTSRKKREIFTIAIGT
jgi:hypothetical protein